MNLEIIKRKKNIFEHIIYEFDMYLFSYFALNSLNEKKDCESIDEYILQQNINLLRDCHFLHMRNLIEFFNNKTDCIGTKTILSVDCDLSIEDNDNYKQTINRSVDHLTIQRVNQADELSDRQNKTIHDMIEIIPKRIKDFLNLLSEDNIKEEYKQNYNDMREELSNFNTNL